MNTREIEVCEMLSLFGYLEVERVKGKLSNYFAREGIVCHPDYIKDINTVVGSNHFVYILYLDSKIVYIGRTAYISKRLKSHIKSDKTFNRIGIYLCKSNVEGALLEGDLIFRNKPIYNKTNGTRCRKIDVKDFRYFESDILEY